jgi:hypothetical protein
MMTALRSFVLALALIGVACALLGVCACVGKWLAWKFEQAEEGIDYTVSGSWDFDDDFPEEYDVPATLEAADLTGIKAELRPEVFKRARDADDAQ